MASVDPKNITKAATPSRTQGSSSSGGMFNFQQMMDDFYKSTPDDAGGKAAKQAYQGNMVQSGFDAMLAQQLATHNSALAQENMTH